MKLSTAEMKRIMKECVKEEAIYTVADFCKYINTKSEKEFTRGQISGALAQLIDSGDIIRVERGLYTGKYTMENSGLEGNNFQETTQFKKETIRNLDNIENMLANFVNSVKVWDLNKEEVDILLMIKELKSSIENTRKKCE